MPLSEGVIDNRSTISAPSKQQTTQQEDVPDFTEFKLENFKMNTSPEITPAPHRLREARRSLALFLEPNPGTPIATSLKTFQEKTFVQFGPNQAHNTQSHISIFSRILIERGHDFFTKWDTVQEFIDVCDEEIKNHNNLKAPGFIGFEILDKPTRSLVINVRVSSDYYSLVKNIEQKMTSKCNALEVSPMNKIHLGYNVLKSLSKTALKRMKDKAEETIDIYDWVKTGGSWRLALYEVMVESQVVGVQQQLNEIKSWPIQKNAEPSVFTSTIPVSLRIKLSFLSNWFKSPFSSKTVAIPLPPKPTDALVVRNRSKALGHQTI